MIHSSILYGFRNYCTLYLHTLSARQCYSDTNGMGEIQFIVRIYAVTVPLKIN
jgi:hypothetical protein